MFIIHIIVINKVSGFYNRQVGIRLAKGKGKASLLLS